MRAGMQRGGAWLDRSCARENIITRRGPSATDRRLGPDSCQERVLALSGALKGDDGDDILALSRAVCTRTALKRLVNDKWRLLAQPAARLRRFASVWSSDSSRALQAEREMVNPTPKISWSLVDIRSPCRERQSKGAAASFSLPNSWREALIGSFIFVHLLALVEISRWNTSTVRWAGVSPGHVGEIKVSSMGSNLERQYPKNNSIFIDHYKGSKEYKGSTYTFGPWRGTQQNMVGVLFRARMKTYQCLTTDWRKAGAFYIPALFGLLTLYGSHLPFYEIEALGDELEVFLGSQPGYLATGGRDHFLVLGQMYKDFMCDKRNEANKDWSWCSYLFHRPMLSKMTMVSVERPFWEQRIQSVPYLTAFHPSTTQELKEWLNHVKNHPRQHTATLLAGSRTNVPIRNVVQAACQSNPARCHFVDCTGECPRGSCRRVIGVCGEPRLVAKEYLGSTFCLMPNGDSATRRSIFDALIAGCIPVHFDPESFDLQYPWHRGEDPARVSVLFDGKKVENGTLDFLSKLRNFPAKRVAEMRRSIFKLIPALVTKDHRRSKGGSYKTKDMFDFAVQGILQHIKKPVEYQPYDSF